VSQPPEPLAHVLVATDFSPVAEHALARAGRLPIAPNGSVMVVHALAEGVPATLRAQVEDFARQRLRRAQATLIDQLAASGRPGIAVSVALLGGGACPEIARCAAENRADLIVLGRQGKTPLQALLIGSTAEGVYRAVEVPTLIVARPARGAYQRPLIAVALDGAGAELALRARRVFGSGVRRKRLLHAYRVPVPGLLPWARASRVLTPLRKHYRELAAAGVAELGSSLEAIEARWEPTIVRGDPRHAIVVEAMHGGSDLIVVGRHARSRLAEAWVGNVADAVVRAAARDVLVVPLADPPAESVFR